MSVYRSVASQHFNERQTRELEQFCKEYRHFLDAAATERLACKEIERQAFAAGFVRFEEASGQTKRQLHVFDGRCGALVRIGSPNKLENGIVIVASHIDSPRLDVKPNPLTESSGIALLKTRYYGGVKKYQWLGIPLAMHGVAFLQDGRSVDISIGNGEDDPVFTITDLAPHLASNQIKKPAGEFIEGEKLNIIFASGGSSGASFSRTSGEKSIKDQIEERLHRDYGLSLEDFTSAEFEIVPAIQSKDVGLDRSFLGGYGQDNRVCTFAAMKAIMACESEGANLMFAFFDKEEIGSQGAHGADSNLLERIFMRVFEQLGSTDWFALKRSMANSVVVSGDVNVGIDPNWKDVTEDLNCARMGAGVCLMKYTGGAGKRGANEADAAFVAKVRRVLNESGVPWQTGEIGKVDAGGGSTVAHYLARIGASVIDAGPPLLSMHSPFEIVSKADIYSSYLAYKAIYESFRR